MHVEPRHRPAMALLLDKCIYDVYTSELEKEKKHMKMQAVIQKWGNSLALRLTGPLCSIPCFEENMPVDIEISTKGLTIHRRLPSQKISLLKEENLLKGLTPHKAHADELLTVSGDEFGKIEW